MFPSTLPVEPRDELPHVPALLCVRLCSRLYEPVRILRPSVPVTRPWAATARCLPLHPPRHSWPRGKSLKQTNQTPLTPAESPPSATSRSFCLVIVTRFSSRPSQTEAENSSDDFNVTSY